MSRIVVLGAGESGAGAAVLAKVKGFDTFVSDMSVIKDKYKEMLDKYGIAWEEGHHTEELILNADEVIKSPGIPNDAPMILKLKAQGTPIISEIEFAGRYTDAKMVCITGSNGKTTTTSLIYHIFKSAGLNVGLAGNIGNSLALQVATEKHAENIRIGDGEIYIDFIAPDTRINNIQLGVPVSINIENGIAAMALAHLNGATDEEIKLGMSSFHEYRIWRRRKSCN